MTSVAPAHRAAPHMTQTPDPTTTPQAQIAAPSAEAKPARSRLRDQIAENPLAGLMLAVLTFLGTVVVALLIFTLNSLGERIDDLGALIDGVEMRLGERIDRVEMRLGARIDGVEARMGRLEAKVDAGFAAQAAQIAELDARLTAQIAGLDRKQTALIAHLNATEAVEAALEHRLLIPDSGTTESEGESDG